MNTIFHIITFLRAHSALFTDGGVGISDALEQENTPEPPALSLALRAKIYDLKSVPGCQSIL